MKYLMSTEFLKYFATSTAPKRHLIIFIKTAETILARRYSAPALMSERKQKSINVEKVECYH